jgi:hypothetical protein
MNGTQTRYQPVTPPAPKKRHIVRNLAIGATGILAVIIVLAATLGSSPSGKPAPYHTPNVSIPAQATTAPEQVFTDSTGGKCVASQVVNNYCPGDAPQYTPAQQQAIEAAQNYLSMGTGFSQAGLLQQLTSSYGNGFSQADAQFAIAHVSVDWNQQAAIAARGYMNLGTGFSYQGLVDQLDSPYGGQFTLAQAQYGAQSVGLTP